MHRIFRTATAGYGDVNHRLDRSGTDRRLHRQQDRKQTRGRIPPRHNPRDRGSSGGWLAVLIFWQSWGDGLQPLQHVCRGYRRGDCAGCLSRDPTSGLTTVLRFSPSVDSETAGAGAAAGRYIGGAVIAGPPSDVLETPRWLSSLRWRSRPPSCLGCRYGWQRDDGWAAGSDADSISRIFKHHSTATVPAPNKRRAPPRPIRSRTGVLVRPTRTEVPPWPVF